MISPTFRPEDLMSLRRNLLKLRKSITHEREILVKICRQGLAVHHRKIDL